MIADDVLVVRGMDGEGGSNENETAESQEERLRLVVCRSNELICLFMERSSSMHGEPKRRYLRRLSWAKAVTAHLEHRLVSTVNRRSLPRRSRELFSIIRFVLDLRERRSALRDQVAVSAIPGGVGKFTLAEQIRLLEELFRLLQRQLQEEAVLN